MQFLRVNDNTNGYVFCEEDMADYALVPIREYHGLQKTLRIVRERALQQINKSKTDEHGYRLLRADRRSFTHGDEDAWYIVKQTPYSSQIDPAAAYEIIMRDFKEFYHYVADATYMDDTGQQVPFDDVYIITYAKYARLSMLDYHNDTNQERTAAMKNLYDAHKGKMVFMVSKIGINYGAGLYEVGYWATDVI